MRRWTVPAALGLLCSGCYAEMSLGTYPIVEGNDVADSAWSWGIAVGAYLEHDPVHVGLGYGGNVVLAEHQGNYPPSLQVHDHIGLDGRFELKMMDLTDDGATGLWGSAAFTWTRSDNIVSIRPTDDDVDDIDHAGWSWAAFAGPAIKGWFAGMTGVRLALGPAILSTVSDSFGTTRALGGQVRLTFLGYPDTDDESNGGTDFFGVFRRGLAAEAGTYDYEEARQRNEAGQDVNRVQQCLHSPNCEVR